MSRIARGAAIVALGLAAIAVATCLAAITLPAAPPAGDPVIFPSVTPYPSNWTYTP